MKFEILGLRARILQSIRSFFVANGFLEVETPIRIPAPAPEPHIEAVEASGWYLQTSPEICMKRLLASGHSRIFQICKCFRSRERGERHLPELTLLEWYCAGLDYLGMMAQTEALIRFVASDVLRGERFTYRGEAIDLSPAWPRMTVHEAFRSLGSLTADEAVRKDLFEEILTAEIEPGLGRATPLFLYDYPASGGALARLKPKDPGIAERFELYIAGIEICNAFSELTDSEEQRRRFRDELSRRAACGEPVYPMPDKFLDALRSMPESAGNALGIDRLVMLFTDSETIDAVVAFPPEAL